MHVITQSIDWENPKPIHGSVKTMGVPTHSQINIHSLHFSDDKSPQGENPGDPRGIEMKIDVMMS